MKTLLAPVVHRRSYDAALLADADAWADEAIFSPLLALLDLEDAARANADGQKTALVAALAAGTITYADGYFSGTFNAATSKELRDLGARRTREKQAGFVLALALIPAYLLAAAHTAALRARTFHDRVETFARQAQSHLAEYPAKITARNTLDRIREDLQLQVSQTAHRPKGEADGTQIPPADLATLEAALTTELENQLAQQSADTLAEILRRVAENRANGSRLDRLRRILLELRERHRRAARAAVENGLGVFVAGVRGKVYEREGIVEYVWRTQRDERVRLDHRDLDNRVFSFSHPPVENTRTGNRANPGEAPNCRCVPLPVVTAAENVA